MIYWIVTTSLIEQNADLREKQYKRAIGDLLKRLDGKPIKVILVENTSRTKSFLDEFGVDVVYTQNNLTPTSNYGIKELQDVLHVVRQYSIQPDDYVVKMTGRYFLSEQSKFLDILLNLDSKYEAVLKYGWWEPSPRTKHADCITGLICMKCKYLKKIRIPENSDTTTAIEHRWAEVTLDIPDALICMLDTLGIHMTSKNNPYHGTTYM